MEKLEWERIKDPTHISKWNKNSFWYITRQQQAKYIDNTTIRFYPVVLDNVWYSNWHKENCIPYVRADLICLKKDKYGNELFRPHGILEI